MATRLGNLTTGTPTLASTVPFTKVVAGQKRTFKATLQSMLGLATTVFKLKIGSIPAGSPPAGEVWILATPGIGAKDSVVLKFASGAVITIGIDI